MEITGAILVGSADRVGEAGFAAVDPATGRNIGPDFHEAGAADVADAAALADGAFAIFSETAPEARALFLETIAKAGCRARDWRVSAGARSASSACSPRSCAKAGGWT